MDDKESITMKYKIAALSSALFCSLTMSVLVSADNFAVQVLSLTEENPEVFDSINQYGVVNTVVEDDVIRVLVGEYADLRTAGLHFRRLKSAGFTEASIVPLDPGLSMAQAISNARSTAKKKRNSADKLFKNYPNCGHEHH